MRNTQWRGFRVDFGLNNLFIFCLFVSNWVFCFYFGCILNGYANSVDLVIHAFHVVKCTNTNAIVFSQNICIKFVCCCSLPHSDCSWSTRSLFCYALNIFFFCSLLPIYCHFKKKKIWIVCVSVIFFSAWYNYICHNFGLTVRENELSMENDNEISQNIYF